MALTCFGGLSRYQRRCFTIFVLCTILFASARTLAADGPQTSLEVRWFVFGHIPDSVDRWFLTNAGLGPKLTAEAGDTRTDVYLLAGDRQDLTIKLREGLLELRQRRGDAETLQVSTASGLAELWSKWEWRYERPGGADAIVEAFAGRDGKGPGISVGKRRLQRKFDQNRDGSFSPVSPKTRIAQGCLVEVTTVSLSTKVAWTVAVESVSPEDGLLLSTLKACAPVLLKEFPEDSLVLKNSYSYATFLRR